MPEFCVIIARKIFSPKFGGSRAPLPAPPAHIKSVNVWRIYGQKFGGVFFDLNLLLRRLTVYVYSTSRCVKPVMQAGLGRLQSESNPPEIFWHFFPNG